MSTPVCEMLGIEQPIVQAPMAAIPRLATAAAEAGADVILEIGQGLPHVYPILLGTPEAAEATEQIGKFLRARVR